MHWITLLAALCIDVSMAGMLISALIESRKYTTDSNVCGWTAVVVMALMGAVLTLALLQSIGVVVW